MNENPNSNSGSMRSPEDQHNEIDMEQFETIGTQTSPPDHKEKILPIVLLVTGLGIVVGLLFYQHGVMKDVFHGIDAVTIMLTVFTFFAIVAIIFMFWVLDDGWSCDDMMIIKVFSSILFSSCSALFFAFEMAMTIECKPITYEIRIVYQLFMIIFYFLQTLLFIFLAKQNINYDIELRCLNMFKHNVSSLIKYAVVMLVATNASIFVCDSVNIYDEEHKKITKNMTVPECHNSSKQFELYHESKPYLEPCIIENSLLALLYIKEIFSREKKTNDNADSVNWWKKYWCIKFIVILFVNILYFASMVFYKKKQSNDDDGRTPGILVGQSVVYLTYKVIILIGIIFGFRFAFKTNKTESTVPSKPSNFTLNHFLILLSTFGSIAYFFVNLMSDGFQDKYWNIVRGILNVATTFLQTLLIMFLKDKIKANEDSYSLLFLAVANFTLWIYNTWFEAQTVYEKEYPLIEDIGIESWHTMRNVLLPLIIFYRFKCFLSFFEMSGFVPPLQWLRKCECNKKDTYQKM